MNVTNGDRVEWARAALETFAATTGRAGECVGTEGRASVLADLLADLLHLCDADGVNFAAALRMGRMFYNDEVTA